MSLAQQKIRWLARMVIGLALFTQTVVAAHACAMPTASPAQAYTLNQDSGAQDSRLAPCHEQDTDNACLAHCMQTDQIGADHSSPLVAPMAPAGLTVSLPPVQLISQAARPQYFAVYTGPPVAILFCSFQI